MRGVDRFGVATEKAPIKTVRRADHLHSGRDLRIKRDLVWLMLSEAGLSSKEIERACLLAARSDAHIRRRLIQLRNRQAKGVA